jgi:hypothetical protein
MKELLRKIILKNTFGAQIVSSAQIPRPTWHSVSKIARGRSHLGHLNAPIDTEPLKGGSNSGETAS